MDFVRSYFSTNEPLTSADLEKESEEKMFNWSEVHLYQSNFLQYPYFSPFTDSFLSECLTYNYNLKWDLILHTLSIYLRHKENYERTRP